ncbi:tetratricopeptide repeat protein [Actinoplanes sp. LDG1-06]|uniref:Tetratricopeptide repeat protein n=1 Tax=Paractinoplanes ovalisporus TaxID=2810368 RepID=A0ABS2ADK2_9ACTN|nr:FxSxx-COOH system tetratricopeptide repeat protein [Actinoplanes ovalisporus]MBM2617898.1 tetratricopeptide repeat protein [Actinoplanes ovalisporus]
MSDLGISRSHLIEVLLRVPGLESRLTRDSRVAELSEALTRDLMFARSDDAAEDLAALLDELLDAPADLRAFGDIIVARHRGDAAQRFAELTVVRPRSSRRHVYRPEERINGDIPIRNRNFTGRIELLERLSRALEQDSTTSVLPPALNGMGGVGKTQLVNEYVHRHLDQYDLIWWIPAEQISTVLSSLTQLAQRLDLPLADDQQETARTVLNWLAGSDREWLLVYDNADDPARLTPLLPSTGGHVIVTTRNEEWSTIGIAIEVDVFQRKESIELLTKRATDDAGHSMITDVEADELADKLGDLPLALEQAAAWYLATLMPIREYIDLLDDRIELLNEGKPPGYPLTVAAFVAVAMEKLRGLDETLAELFAMFAFLGGDGIRQSLLRRGSSAALSAPLSRALQDSMRTSQMVRELRRYGLAKTVSRSPSATTPASADKSPRLQVHRLVQRVLRDTLDPAERDQALRNVQNLLAVANPGDPDEIGELDLQSEMGPHLRPADMIHSGTPQGRQTVLDHARFLYITGDFDSSRQLAADASEGWAAEDPADPHLGPDGQSTLLARAQVANATRQLGDSQLAADIIRDTYERFVRNPNLGPRNAFTLITGNQLGHVMRIDGQYRDALEFDQQSARLHKDVFGDDEVYTLRVRSNVAVDQRLMGEFDAARALDEEVASHYAGSGRDVEAFRMNINVARNYYGLGQYKKALQRLEEWLPLQKTLIRDTHPLALMAQRTHAITLRKLGRLDDAVQVMREAHERTVRTLNEVHEHSVVAAMSLANAYRQAGQLEPAAKLMQKVLDRYRTDFGHEHPLTLAAEVNQAVLLRAQGEVGAATGIDETAYARLRDKLGPGHAYTICAGTSLATDYAATGRTEEALALSKRVVELSQAAGDHPYVLMRIVNLAHDLRATGEPERASEVFDDAHRRLRELLGAEHPEVLLVAAGRRLEGDIEPPPT